LLSKVIIVHGNYSTFVSSLLQVPKKVRFASLCGLEMVETPKSVTKSEQSSSKSLLKTKSSFAGNLRRESTGRRLSFSDENGGNLAKVRAIYILCCSLFQRY